ncbi:MAG: hypothetical protein JNN16_14695 [Nitrospira sp.]|nr:hypothetical protein [Nitrospira sp.]
MTTNNSSIRGGDIPLPSQGTLSAHNEIRVRLIEKEHSPQRPREGEQEKSFDFLKPVKADIGDSCTGNKDCSHEVITYESRICPEGLCKADLFIVEFNDQGLMYHPQQMEHLFEFLHNIMSPHTCQPGERKPCFDDVNLVVATHGWRHNADFEDWNLRQLREALYSAVLFEAYNSSTSERLNPSRKPRKVVGVYLGWRGALIKEYPNSPRIPFTDSWTLSDVALGLPAVLSFWDRKETALNVALGSARELFTRLGHIRAAVNDMNDPGNNAKRMGRDYEWHAYCEERARESNSKCVAMRTLILGHSFGALAIYNAISESLMNSITSGAWDTTVSSPYADLIVLINPAFEGARFEPLYQASLNRMRPGAGHPTQSPILVLVTGTSDYATRYAFPIGRLFSTLFQSSSQKNKDGTEMAGRADEELNANRNTVGHIPRYMTHYLDSFLTLPDIEPEKDTDSSLGVCLKTSWDKLARTGVAGAKSLPEALDENAIKWKQKLWASIKTEKGWPARAFCGGFRLSPAMHEAREGKDPLEDLPDQSTDQAPWANQLLSKNISSDKWGSRTRDPYNPIWVVRTKDKRIINGHNGFQTPSMVAFIRQLYREVLK